MKKIVSLSMFVLLAGIVSTSFLYPQEQKRSRFTISLFGGGLSGVGFLSGYRGGAGGGNIIPEYDAGTEGPLLEKLSAGMFGFSLGYIVGFGRQPGDSNFWLSGYIEATYCPTAKFRDGTETRTWEEWDQAQFRFIEKSDTFPQTGRKAGMYGATMGVVVMPFRKVPLGLDLGIGWWKFTQSYTSGTMQFLEGKTDVSAVTSEGADTGLTTTGQGRLERNHSALLIKIGLTYKISKFMSLDMTFRSAAYLHTYETGLIYVESGEDVKNIQARGLGNLLSGGITLFF